MKNKQVTRIFKKLTFAIFAVGMLVIGIVVCPKQADAVVVEDKVIYLNYDEYDINKYWNSDEAKRKAPVKEGYVFGGWFASGDESTPLTEAELKTQVPNSAYAKFVPAQVLSVKAQNGVEQGKNPIESASDITKDNPMYVRVMSSLDSENYQKVGFDIYLANSIRVYKGGTLENPTLEPTETTTIYTGIKEGKQTKTANEIFGGESEFLSVWKLSAIDYAGNASLIIYVRPYWITTDGTKVNGLAKYVHIEDDYLDLINVPVNLLGGEQVAAGAVDITYTGNGADDLQFVEFEQGRIFSKMTYSHKDGSTLVKMIGNQVDIGMYDDKGETIYANLRFKKLTTNAEVDFNIVNEPNKFCDWNENYVDVKKVWDTKYVQTTTKE